MAMPEDVNGVSPRFFDGSPFVHELMKAVIVYDTNRFFDTLKMHECKFQWLKGTVREKRIEVYGKPYGADTRNESVYYDAALVIEQPYRKVEKTQLATHFFEIKTGHVTERLLTQLDCELRSMSGTHLQGKIVHSLNVIIPYRSIDTLFSSLTIQNPNELGRRLHLLPLEWFIELLQDAVKTLVGDIRVLSDDLDIPWTYRTKQVRNLRSGETVRYPSGVKLEDFF